MTGAYVHTFLTPWRELAVLHQVAAAMVGTELVARTDIVQARARQTLLVDIALVSMLRSPNVGARAGFTVVFDYLAAGVALGKHPAPSSDFPRNS